jgi:carbonic anhydrase/acetyltransferase-like protein (isoleucine patch superfamily)
MSTVSCSFHTLENMMLKVKRTHIQDGCAVNTGATVMGGAVIERDTTLYPLSLVLKEMNLVTGAYEGSPAQPAPIAEKGLKAEDYLATFCQKPTLR